MEEQWLVDRAQFRQLMNNHPTWSNQQYADACERSKSWVKKWKRRLCGTALEDESVLHSQSRARKTPPAPYAAAVIERILALRDNPPEAVSRKIGPVTILYYLHQDEALKAAGHRLPRSSSTVWAILDHHQRIIRRSPMVVMPFERPAPLDTWEIDFTDVAGVQAQDDRKQMHQVEAFAVVDRGTSILVDLQVSDAYQAPSALIAMANTLIRQGMPRRIVFDRDPRFVGSWSAGGFPSAFMRFLLCLGIEVEVCPPQRPDRKPFVERYFRTLNSECVQVHRPDTLQEARALFDDYRFIYNQQRPNQATTCGNQPPYLAFTSLPSLPPIPLNVDPAAWLTRYPQRLYKRRIDHAGRVQLDKHRYYIQRALAGRYVVCKVHAEQRVLDVYLARSLVKTIPLKGLYDAPLSFDAYLRLAMHEAEAEQRQLARRRYLCAA